ncbi:MAG: DUF1513 domain-containing protein [Pikeienuella sp.]
MATRRDLLGRLALGLGVMACRSSFGQPAEGAVYVGVETSARTEHSIASFFGASGARLGTVRLDFRAHGLARQGPLVTVFPRRPGTRFAVIDRDTLEIRAVVDAPPDRHFYGHGAFTQDGRTLLVTENHLDTLRGGVGVYEITPRVRRLGEIELAGSGPHEIARHPSKDLFFIALGGLETHPAYGRTPLNLGSFRSEIVALDYRATALGALGVWPGSEGVSLRHLAMDGTGRLYVGGQVEDAVRAATPRLAWVVDGDRVAPVQDLGAFGGYVSSVAAWGCEALLTSKVASAAVRLRGTRVTDRQALDGAGAAALGPNLAAVSGYSVLRLNGAAVAALALHEFDNHGLSVAPGG